MFSYGSPDNYPRSQPTHEELKRVSITGETLDGDRSQPTYEELKLSNGVLVEPWPSLFPAYL